MDLKQSFCYPCFTNDEVSFSDVCEAAARIGYVAVELWGRDDQFVERVTTAKANGLVVASMCGHRGIGSGYNDPEQFERIESELNESIELAAEHGIPNLICFSGERRDGQSDEEAIGVCADGLRRIAPRAEAAGITLNMELLNSKVDHPGYQCDHTEWGVAVCEKVASPNFKLLYDIYHMQIMEGDVIRTIRDNVQWIGHMHTAGNPGRNDLDDAQELNYLAIAEAIRATSYSGFVAHEFWAKGDPLVALETAYRICAG
jgi:hydroxypyruvate isomerase